MNLRKKLAVALLAAAMLLAGCAGGDSPETLEELLGWGGPGEEARLQARMREVESLVADCMAGHGFTYIPVEYVDPGRVVGAPDEELSREEYVRRYGFGMTRWLDETDDVVQPPTEWHDPNDEIVEALSDAERNAYYIALYGIAPIVDGPAIPIDDGPGIPIDDYAPAEETGCSAEAREAVYGESERVWEELSDEFDALHQRIEADPRIAESLAAWASCMRAAGYDYADKHALVNYLDEKLNEEVYRFGEEDPGVVHGPWTPPQVDQAALAAFRVEEITLATADYHCDLEADLEGVRARVTAEHESRFIAAHRDELEVLRGDS